MLDTTTAAVNSALQRARARLEKEGVAQDEVDEPADPDQRAMVDQYVTAFEDADIVALTRLLTEDAVLEMPPFRNWFVGREDYSRFVAHIFAVRGANWRMIRTSANGQPAVGAYLRGDGEAYRAHSIQVFTVTRAGIARTTAFQDPDLFGKFDLPPSLAPTASWAGSK
jgi:RNA polymerase sigma-70 factor (ECF subfamily)